MDKQTAFKIPLYVIGKELDELDKLNNRRLDFLKRYYPPDWYELAQKDSVLLTFLYRKISLKFFAEKVYGRNWDEKYIRLRDEIKKGSKTSEVYGYGAQKAKVRT